MAKVSRSFVEQQVLQIDKEIEAGAISSDTLGFYGVKIQRVTDKNVGGKNGYRTYSRRSKDHTDYPLEQKEKMIDDLLFAINIQFMSTRELNELADKMRKEGKL